MLLMKIYRTYVLAIDVCMLLQKIKKLPHAMHVHATYIDEKAHHIFL